MQEPLCALPEARPYKRDAQLIVQSYSQDKTRQSDQETYRTTSVICCEFSRKKIKIFCLAWLCVLVSAVKISAVLLKVKNL